VRVGDLVRNLNSESGLIGIIVGWKETKWADERAPVVAWQDGRVSWIMTHRLSVVV